MLKIRRAVTLVELIAVVVIVSVAFAALMAVLSTVTKSAWYSDGAARAVLCAQSQVERALAPGGSVNNSTSTCPDGTNYNITVNNVTLGANNTWITGAGSPQCQLIKVNAWRSGGGASTNLYCFSNCSS